MTLFCCYFMLRILYLKATRKSNLKQTNIYRMIDATLIPGNQILFFMLLQPTQIKFKQQQKNIAVKA